MMKNESSVASYFLQMVRIDSESGEEKDFLKFVEHLFIEEFKANTQYDNFGNLLIRIKPKYSLKNEPILFCCHGDTVKPGKGIEPVIEDGIIHSTGNTILGADDKAGIAEILVALKEAPQYPPIEILITRQEEVGLSGSDQIDPALIKAKKGYVLDTEDLDEIIIGGPSRIELMIKIKGKSAHAVEPEKGISAIEVAARGISLLKTGWIDPITTVNIGLIEGGQVVNAVPENTIIQMECRSQNHQKCLCHSKQIKNLFQSVAKAMGARAEVELKLSLRASRISENDEVVKMAQKAIRSVGLTPVAKIICGGTDASNLNKKGIKTAVLGVGGKLPHSKDEHIAIKDMDQAVKILISLLKEYSI